MSEVSMVTFDLWGTTPAPQGSKNPWGGEANKNTKPWREAVAAEAARVMREADYALFDGPVKVTATLFFPRPKGHYRPNGQLRDTAPNFKESAPDLDKLERALGDAMTGVVLRDDARIAWWDVSKRYVNDDTPHPGVIITVRKLRARR